MVTSFRKLIFTTTIINRKGIYKSNKNTLDIIIIVKYQSFQINYRSYVLYFLENLKNKGKIKFNQ